MSCWFKNPGECGQKDDMQILYPKFRDADVIVYATPVYYAGVTGPLKNLMDRQLPLHMLGELGAKRQKIVLVSTCGAWEMSMFEPLLVQMKALYTRSDGSSDFVGALLRPGADGMREMMKTKGRGLVEGILQAAKEAGRELVKEGKISEEIQKQVSRELMPRDAYYEAAKEMFEQIKKSMKE
jgi:multimeric flavodoxin WrbA